MTFATDDITGHPASSPLTCASVDNCTVTVAPAAAAAAAAATTTIKDDADEEVTAQLGCRPMIDGENTSTLFAPGLASEVSLFNKMLNCY